MSGNVTDKSVKVATPSSGTTVVLPSSLVFLHATQVGSQEIRVFGLASAINLNKKSSARATTLKGSPATAKTVAFEAMCTAQKSSTLNVSLKTIMGVSVAMEKLSLNEPGPVTFKASNSAYPSLRYTFDVLPTKSARSSKDAAASVPFARLTLKGIARLSTFVVLSQLSGKLKSPTQTPTLTEFRIPFAVILTG